MDRMCSLLVTAVHNLLWDQRTQNPYINGCNMERRKVSLTQSCVMERSEVMLQDTSGCTLHYFAQRSILSLTPCKRETQRPSGCWWCVVGKTYSAPIPLTMVGSLKQDSQVLPEIEKSGQRPLDRDTIQELRGKQRPLMAKVQEPRTQQEGKTPPGKRQPEHETTRDFKVQLQLLRLQAEPKLLRDNDDKKQTKCEHPAETRQLEGDSHGMGRCLEEHMLQVKLHDMQDMLEQKKKEHEEMCKKFQEGGTDLEKHRDLLVSENGRLRQELQQLKRRLECENNQELAAMRQRLLHMEQEESERKTLICALQQEVEQKSERLAEAELRMRDSVREKVEEEERLNRRLREYQLSQQPQIKYVVKTVEVESGKMKAALSQAEARSLHLQEQLDRQNQAVQDMKRQLQNEQQEVAKLRAQVALYASELDLAQEQMVKEFHSLQEEKEIAVSEAFQRAQEEMRAVHQSLDGVRRNLLMLQPALRTLTHDYNALKKQVRDFPGLLYEAMREARDEFSQAVKRVQDTNTELLSKYQRELYLRKECHNQLVRLRGNIRVFARVRPVTSGDGTGLGAKNVVTFDRDDDGILHITNKGKIQSFELDKVFPPSTTQEEVFDEVSPLITSCLDGYNVCILAYGQTGSGKTYSMEGTAVNPGINQRALHLLLSVVSERSRSWEHHLTISMAEIYNETLRDLLGSDCHSSLEIKMAPGGAGELYVPGLTQRSVRNMQDINKILELGRKQRATEHTNANAHSSRSHALLILTAKGRETSTGICTTGKLYLVDLAGSERVSRSGAAGERLREAQCINRSLSALGDVFSALRAQQAHVPYRNSKLTYLLQEALSRDGKALLLVQVSPVEQNINESLCSLRFGDRVRSVELGVPSKKIEQLPPAGTESSESDSPSTRATRTTSVRKKVPTSVRQRIGPP
ncbi:kinesin-like protein KIFC3 isoform 2-T2 [Leptodactylus fuscus]|uniref:kinesin-like protein KIFC3 isoform X2 n=1 Tax=Leptodactylus fuscus TaxID=238119 RepID=UPI003F4EA038